MHKIGIGITTHNRPKIFSECFLNIRKFMPENAKLVIVDDASEVPVKEATFRFEVNAGIAKAKNKCFELLDDCDYIFLFDDDCWPKVKDWYLPYINSGENHLSFTFSGVKNGRENGNFMIHGLNDVNIFSNPCGCMLFFTKKCLEIAGGFNDRFDKYGYEHVELSTRIFNLHLTTYKFSDVKNSLDLFHSLDYEGNAQSSVTVKHVYSFKNQEVYEGIKNSTEFVPYKEKRKNKYGNIILTSYFNYSHDPQRGNTWQDEVKNLIPLINSCSNNKQRLIIFTNLNFDYFFSELVEFVLIDPSLTHSPNDYRWIAYHNWMKQNEFKNCWMVDSTDVTLLKNPFNIIKPNLLYCGDEFDMITDNKWMRSTQERFLKIKDYRKVISSFSNERLINCGLVGGSFKVIAKLLNYLVDIHKSNPAGLNNATDMAAFNYVVRKYFNYILIHGEQINTKFKHFETDNKTAIWKHK